MKDGQKTLKAWVVWNNTDLTEGRGDEQHFTECGTCGDMFDMRDLTQVCFHETHRPMAVVERADGAPITGERYGRRVK